MRTHASFYCYRNSNRNNDPILTDESLEHAECRSSEKIINDTQVLSTSYDTRLTIKGNWTLMIYWFCIINFCTYNIIKSMSYSLKDENSRFLQRYNRTSFWCWRKNHLYWTPIIPLPRSPCLNMKQMWISNP